MSSSKISDFNILKILGVIPSNIQEDLDKKIKVKCPFHDDENASLVIDNVNTYNENANNFSSSRCHACASKQSNINAAKYWLDTFTERDSNDKKEWIKAQKMFDSIRKDLFLEEKNYTNKDEILLFGNQRSYDYTIIKKTLLEIFDNDTLYELNQDWEDELKYLVDMKELGVERQNEGAPWYLLFKVGFGNDYNIGGVRYQYNMEPKYYMTKTSTSATKEGKTPVGLFMPFYFNKTEAGSDKKIVNPNISFDSNLFANNRNNIFIVEGQKDMLTLRLIGIPAITITGGAGALALYPQIFTDKNIYIIYDNDKAGDEGAKKLALQLVDYAKTIKVSTGVYKGLESKEDAFDFFFKYKNTKKDFASLLANNINFDVYDMDVLEKERIEAKKLLKKEENLRNIEILKKETKNNELSFNELFSAEPHKKVKVKARLNGAEKESDHSIYLRPLLHIKDYRNNLEQSKLNISKQLLDLKAKIEISNNYFKNEYGKDRFTVKYDILETEDGKELIQNFTIERHIDENDLDIIEKILFGKNGKDESVAYANAGAWKELKKALDEFTTNLNKRVVKRSSDIEKSLKEGNGEEVDDTYANITQLVSRKADTPIQIMTKSFNKKYVIDFSKVKIYEDKSHKEITEHVGSHVSLYTVYIPSHLLKSTTKVGDKVTLYGGKLKKIDNNMPYFVALHMDYRDEIDDFLLTEDVKKSLNRSMFKGSTKEELIEHQNKMYYLWRKLHSEDPIAKKMWESVELTYSSVARSLKEQEVGEPRSFNSTLDVLLMGDTRIGKSRSVELAREVYGVGSVAEFENVTAKGLIGGSDKDNNIVLGKIPLNHRGLVQLDELSAISRVEDRQEFFKNLHVLRMDGVAIIVRVAGEVKAPSDVRLITTSNTASKNGVEGSNPPMRDFKAGSYWKAVLILINSLPILSRFTFIYLATEEETNEEIDEGKKHSQVNITNKIAEKGWVYIDKIDYQNKINWIWSRKPSNSIISVELNKYIKEEVSKRLRPLFQIKDGVAFGIYTNGTTPLHITNMAIALAASTISTDETYENVIVKEIHVDYAIDYIIEIYGDHTGIPKYIESNRKISEVGSSDINKIFGKELVHFHKFIKNKVLTLSDKNDTEIRAHMYNLYKTLYEFSTDSGEGSSTQISWAHVQGAFDHIQSRWNSIINNPMDSARHLYDNIANEYNLNKNTEIVSSWRYFMKEIGVIKERSQQKKTFFLQPKFNQLWNEIHEKYKKLYDLDSHEPLDKGGS